MTEAGGLLSHAAIVARELKIPCVVGVSDAVARFGNRKAVRVDADSGDVSVVERSEAVSTELRSNPVDSDSLFCVDEWFRVTVPGVVDGVVCEPSPKGLIVHASATAQSDDAAIRAYMYRALGPVAMVTFGDDKYNWMDEWEQMQTLPHIRWLLGLGLVAVRQLSSTDLAAFYQIAYSDLEVVSSLCNNLEDEQQPLSLRLAVGEWCQAMNFVAGAVIPEGYGVRALVHEACRVGIDPRELLTAGSSVASDPKDIGVAPDVLEFAKVLAAERNTIYSRLDGLVQGIDGHFRFRDSVLKGTSERIGIVSSLRLYTQFEKFGGAVRKIGLSLDRPTTERWTVNPQ